MTSDDLDIRTYALAGARAQLARILEAFPELREGAAPPTPFRPSRKRHVMSAAARKAISARMTAMWAERRAAKGAGAKGRKGAR